MSIQNIDMGTRLLLALEEKGRETFTTDDAKEMLGTGDPSVWQTLNRLASKGRIKKIRRSVYHLIPARAGLDGHWDPNLWEVTSQLADRYYLAFWSALYYWDMTEQIIISCYIATTEQKGRKEIVYMKRPYEFISLSEKKFFGFENVKVGGITFNVSSREKTIVDCLMHPEFCGGIPVATQAMGETDGDIDWDVVLEMAERTGVNVVLKRLGFLLDLMGMGGSIPRRIARKIKRYPYQYLDYHAVKKRVAVSKEYGLVINRTRNALLDWRYN